MKEKNKHQDFSGFSFKAICQIGSYLIDYNFKKIEPKYLTGMSVHPVMTAQLAHEIYLQWFKKTPI